MEVQFYYTNSDSRVINKNLITGEVFSGQARDEVDIMAPVIRFDTDEVLQYNYAFIPQFGRYYYVTGRNAFREGLFDVTFGVDVLMSFRGDISQLVVICDKQSMEENGDEYIDDSSLVAESVMFQTVYNFPNGFNSTGEFILITAG